MKTISNINREKNIFLNDNNTKNSFEKNINNKKSTIVNFIQFIKNFKNKGKHILFFIIIFIIIIRLCIRNAEYSSSNIFNKIINNNEENIEENIEELDANILLSIYNKLKRFIEMSLDEAKFLNGIVRKYKPKKIVEIGVSLGGTSALILNAIKDL